MPCHSLLCGVLRQHATALALVVLSGIAHPVHAEEPPFDDQLFRRCVGWMLSGKGGAMIENMCIAEYSIPAPSLAGFDTELEREVCATVFDEQAKRARGARIR